MEDADREVETLSSEELDRWSKTRNPYGVTRHNDSLAIVATALEWGAPLPKPVREYAAKILGAIIKKNIRGRVFYRDASITGLLIDLENMQVPLFPNRGTGRQPGQTYGYEIVIEAFKKVGVILSKDAVQKVWKDWSRRRDWAELRQKNWPPTEFVRTFFKKISPGDILLVWLLIAGDVSHSVASSGRSPTQALRGAMKAKLRGGRCTHVITQHRTEHQRAGGITRAMTRVRGGYSRWPARHFAPFRRGHLAGG
jgi:hypothetical protein